MVSLTCRQLVVLAALVLSIFLYYVNASFGGAHFNVLALLFLVGVVFFLPSSFSQAWAFIIYFFGLLFAISANVLVEYFSSYLAEIKEYAHPTGGAARNAFLASVFFCSIFVFFNLSGFFFSKPLKRISVVDNIAVKAFILGGGALVAYMAAVVVFYGSPLMMGVDRFFYWANVAPAGYRYVVSLVPTFGFAISYAREVGVLKNSFALGWLFFAALLLILGGEKFSGLIVLVFFYYLPYFCMSNRPLSGRLVGWWVGGLVFAVVLVLTNYYLIYGADFLDKFETRLALQGQMLFALDEVSFGGGGASLRHFLGIGEEANEKGIRYLMYLIAPVEVVDGLLSGGATFTAPFPANLSYFFGLHGAPVVIFLLGGLIGSAGWVLYQALRDRVFLLGLVALKYFFYVYIAVMMGEIYMLFDWKMVVYVLSILFFFLILGANIGNGERR